MEFTNEEQDKIANLITKGEKFQVIAKKIGGGCSWQDIQAFCWQSGNMSWQGSKKMISSRLKKLATAGTRAEREQLAAAIRERVDYLYYCARGMKEKIDAFEKVAAKFIKLT
jgi:hypothetical protein